MNILEYLDIDENTYNNLVIDYGFAYVTARRLPATTEFWLSWWGSWLDGDYCELSLGQMKYGQIQTYITTQLMAYELTRNPTQHLSGTDGGMIQINLHETR